MKHQCESFDGACSMRMVDSGFSRWSGSTLRMTTNPLRLAASGPGYPAGGHTRFMSARWGFYAPKVRESQAKRPFVAIFRVLRRQGAVFASRQAPSGRYRRGRLGPLPFPGMRPSTGLRGGLAQFAAQDLADV